VREVAVGVEDRSDVLSQVDGEILEGAVHGLRVGDGDVHAGCLDLAGFRVPVRSDCLGNAQQSAVIGAVGRVLLSVRLNRDQSLLAEGFQVGVDVRGEGAVVVGHKVVETGLGCALHLQKKGVLHEPGEPQPGRRCSSGGAPRVLAHEAKKDELRKPSMESVLRGDGFAAGCFPLGSLVHR
jgi:hypothetical protein